jgi:transcriptional regulator with XRE-family HTH domain
MDTGAATLISTSRRSARVTQSELARRLGTTQSAVAQLERPGSNPTVARLDAALHALGLRLELACAPHPSDIDVTLLVRNLRMTPAERLSAFETAHREIEELRALMPDAG